jgi:hypothetical protein
MFGTVTHQDARQYVKDKFAGQKIQMLHTQDSEEPNAVDVIFILDERTECMTVWMEQHGIYGEW